MAIQNRALTWAGRILTGLIALLFVFSGSMKLMNPPELKEQWVGKFGYPEDLRVAIGILEIGCALVYLFPRTAILGAVLLTGYLGGATATHVRVHDNFAPPVIIGMLVWLAVYLREPRVRALLPFKFNEAAPPPGAPARTSRRMLRVLIPILFGAAVLLGVLLALVAMQPNEFRVTRTAEIDAPPDAVFPHINNLHDWEAWSPWAKLDPAVKNTYEGPPAGPDAVFSWSGDNRVGAGRMTILESRPSELVQIKLDFERPMKCTNTAEFTLKSQGDQTKVTWTMYGPNLFMGKVMGLFINMDKMVGGEFEQGLTNLKSVVEGAAK